MYNKLAYLQNKTIGGNFKRGGAKPRGDRGKTLKIITGIAKDIYYNDGNIQWKDAVKKASAMYRSGKY